MKIQELQVVFNCLDRSTELSRSTSTNIQRPDQPHEISLIRLNFEDSSMYQVDEAYTVIQKGSFKITFHNSEPDNLVIHGDGKSPEPAGYDGSVMDLLQEYQCPISYEDLIKMRTVYTRVILTLSY